MRRRAFLPSNNSPICSSHANARKGVGSHPRSHHKVELQALAIREKKIYLQELPAMSRQPVELFVDMEGVPDGCVQRALVALTSPLELVSGLTAIAKTRPTSYWLAPPATLTS